MYQRDARASDRARSTNDSLLLRFPNEKIPHVTLFLFLSIENSVSQDSISGAREFSPRLESKVQTDALKKHLRFDTLGCRKPTSIER